MKRPRQVAGRGRLGRPATILTGTGATGAASFSSSPKSPQKPPEPFFYSETRTQTAKTSRSFIEAVSPHNPPELPGLPSTPPGTAEGAPQNLAPRRQNFVIVWQGGSGSSAGGFGGVGSYPLPFPVTEYLYLCSYHARLAAYIEDARGDVDNLEPLERLASAMLDRISELHALGTAGGWL